MKISKTVLLILLLLFCSAIYLRFYQLDKLFFFNIDEDWFLYIVRKIVVFHKPVLIGWEMPGGLLTLPVMYYLGSVIMFLGNNNPLGLAVNAALIGTLSVILTFIVGQKIFNNTRLATIAAFLFCFSYLVIIYTRVTLSIYIGPLLSLLTYYSLTKIITDKKFRWFYMLVVVFIFATQEGSLLSLILLSIFILTKYRKKFPFNKLIIPAILLILSVIPVFIFDLRHEFLASKRVINFFSLKGNSRQSIDINPSLKALKIFGSSIVRTYFATGQPNLNYQILPCERYLSNKESTTPGFYPYIGLLLVLAYIGLSKITKPKSLGEEIIVTHLSLIVIGLLLYSLLLPSHQHEWFFVLLMPAYTFIAASLADRLIKTGIKLLELTVIFVLLFFLFHNLKYLFTTSTIGYHTKYQVVTYIKEQLQNNIYDIDVIGDKCNAYGYRYLLTYAGIEPNISYMDSQYNNWLYPGKVYVQANYQVYIVPHEDLTDQASINQYAELSQKAISKKLIDSVEVIILPKVIK